MLGSSPVLGKVLRWAEPAKCNLLIPRAAYNSERPLLTAAIDTVLFSGLSDEITKTV